MMRRVILESPYRGPGIWPLSMFRRWSNIRYARRCMLDCLRRGDSPMVSHLLYTQVLDDNDMNDRRDGIAAGLVWGFVADATVVYTDRGITIGMHYGIAAAEGNRPIEYRELYKKG